MRAWWVVSAPTSTAEWLTAVGTVFLGFVALLVGVLPSLVGWWRRPRVTIEVGHVEPLARPMRDGVGVLGTALRVAITNRGRSEARRMVATLEHWWYELTTEPNQWSEHDIDPSPLRWIGMPPPDKRAFAPPTQDLLPGGTGLVELVECRTRTGETRLLLDPLDVAFRKEARGGFGHFRAQISVRAANARGVTAVVAWTVDHEHGVTDVGLRTPPASSERSGLYNIFERFSDEPKHRTKRRRFRGRSY